MSRAKTLTRVLRALISVCLTAGVVPTARALSVEPNEALRVDG